MRISLSFKPRKNLKNIIKHLDKIDNTNAEWGIYQESGIHPEANMSYARLMAIHELRTDGYKRPIFTITSEREEWRKSYFNLMASGMINYIKGAGKNKTVSINKVLKPVAQLGAENARWLFGKKEPYLRSNSKDTIARKGFNSPMIELGKLKTKVKFKVRKKGESNANRS